MFVEDWAYELIYQAKAHNAKPAFITPANVESAHNNNFDVLF